MGGNLGAGQPGAPTAYMLVPVQQVPLQTQVTIYIITACSGSSRKSLKIFFGLYFLHGLTDLRHGDVAENSGFMQYKSYFDLF